MVHCAGCGDASRAASSAGASGASASRGYELVRCGFDACRRGNIACGGARFESSPGTCERPWLRLRFDAFRHASFARRRHPATAFLEAAIAVDTAQYRVVLLTFRHHSPLRTTRPARMRWSRRLLVRYPVRCRRRLQVGRACSRDLPDLSNAVSRRCTTPHAEVALPAARRAMRASRARPVDDAAKAIALRNPGSIRRASRRSC